MKIQRRFTALHHDPYHGIVFHKRLVEIREEGGDVVFRAEVVAPDFWSQTAVDLLASKYLWRGSGPVAAENDVRQAIHRLTLAWRHWGEKAGIFSAKEDADAYVDEMAYMLVRQMGSPNSPQWFNTGVFLAYGIKGPPQGHYAIDLATKQAQPALSSYERPQVHACFIQSVQDNLVGAGGINDLWLREARLFKYGSGSGTNFSALRGKGEPLSGGGVSSGVLSFLKVGDASAGAIQSGGTTRRAAKMVCLDIDHPDIAAFIEWKAREERKVAALVTGSRLHRWHLRRVWEASFLGESELEKALHLAREAQVLEPYLAATLECAKRADPPPEFPELDADWRHEAYQSVTGQNSNNSVVVSDAFLKAVHEKKPWPLKRRSDGKEAGQVPARALWNQIARAAWECADPGLHFGTAINAWHTCSNDGPIQASNPCSEYFFLEDTGCNLASLNLLRFYDPATAQFQEASFRQAIRLWVVTLEISVTMAGYPSERIARRSSDYRTLGLGYANLGALLMAMGLAYDSPAAVGLAAALTAWMTGEAYAVSAELAKELGPFARFEANREPMLQVIQKHQSALPHSSHALIQHAVTAWKRAWEEGSKSGFRNAQVTAIAPTGTIGLVMDCDTLGIEPEFALVKFKKLAGGGVLKIPNRSVGPALRALGYSPEQVSTIEKYIVEESTIEGAPFLQEKHLAVFDCADRNGEKGQRVLNPLAHLHMVAAVQPFVSGGISKTVNLPHSASPQNIQEIYEKAAQMGIKAISVYRSGSKLSQPLDSRADKEALTCEECG
jgi:ribonucleoside-diphosphate reductase alpha chain